jgi:hypothetical protein
MLLLILATASLVSANPTVPKKYAFRVKRSLYGHNLKTSAPSPSHEQNTTGGDASNPGFCICDGSESCTKLMPGDTCDSFDMETCTMRQDEGCQWTAPDGHNHKTFAPSPSHEQKTTGGDASNPGFCICDGSESCTKLMPGDTCDSFDMETCTMRQDEGCQWTVTFSVNIGSTEVDFACCGPYDKHPGSDTLFRRSYQEGERFQGKNDDGRICFGCGNSKTITVTPSFDQNIQLPYGTTITCPPVVNKANWLSSETHGDTFGITVAGNKITAQRTDKSGSWGIDLKFKCTASPTTAAEDAANKKDAALATTGTDAASHPSRFCGHGTSYDDTTDKCIVSYESFISSCTTDPHLPMCGNHKDESAAQCGDAGADAGSNTDAGAGVGDQDYNMHDEIVHLRISFTPLAVYPGGARYPKMYPPNVNFTCEGGIPECTNSGFVVGETFSQFENDGIITSVVGGGGVHVDITVQAQAGAKFYNCGSPAPPCDCRGKWVPMIINYTQYEHRVVTCGLSVPFKDRTSSIYYGTILKVDVEGSNNIWNNNNNNNAAPSSSNPVNYTWNNNHHYTNTPSSSNTNSGSTYDPTIHLPTFDSWQSTSMPSCANYCRNYVANDQYVTCDFVKNIFEGGGPPGPSVDGCAEECAEYIKIATEKEFCDPDGQFYGKVIPNTDAGAGGNNMWNNNNNNAAPSSSNPVNYTWNNNHHYTNTPSSSDNTGNNNHQNTNTPSSSGSNWPTSMPPCADKCREYIQDPWSHVVPIVTCDLVKQFFDNPPPVMTYYPNGCATDCAKSIKIQTEAEICDTKATPPCPSWSRHNDDCGGLPCPPSFCCQENQRHIKLDSGWVYGGMTRKQGCLTGLHNTLCEWKDSKCIIQNNNASSSSDNTGNNAPSSSDNTGNNNHDYTNTPSMNHAYTNDLQSGKCPSLRTSDLGLAQFCCQEPDENGCLNAPHLGEADGTSCMWKDSKCMLQK